MSLRQIFVHFLLALALTGGSLCFCPTLSAQSIKMRLLGDFEPERLSLTIELESSDSRPCKLEVQGKGLDILTRTPQFWMLAENGKASARYPVHRHSEHRGEGEILLRLQKEGSDAITETSLQFHYDTVESHLDASLPRADDLDGNGFQHFTEAFLPPSGMAADEALALVRAVAHHKLNAAEEHLANELQMNPLAGRIGQSIRLEAARELLQRGGASEAVEILSPLPDEFAVVVNLSAIARQQAGDSEGASKLLNDYLENHQSPWHRCLYYNLGRIQHLAGNTQDAAAAYSSALSINSQHHAARQALSALDIIPPENDK